MKNLLLLIGLLFTTYSVSAQESVAKDKRHLVEISDDFYEVHIESSEGTLSQSGYYRHVNNEFVREGIWKLYGSDKKILTTAEFKNDELVWIKSNGVVHTSKDIEISRLRKRVDFLEREIVASTNIQ